LIQKRYEEKFVNYLKEEITAAYGDYPAESPDFARL
jgi:aldehyde dehydrogenase (NAD+)